MRKRQDPSRRPTPGIDSAIFSRAAIAQRDEALASSTVDALRSPGGRLDDTTRELMESRLAADFSRVRVHTDERAGLTARALGARAYTLGEDVVFGAGEYQPRTARGLSLIAHELTHVAQQRRSRSDGPAQLGPQGGRHEREAEQVAERIAGGWEEGRAPAVEASETVSARAIQRTLLGGILGGIGGAGAGALIGGLLGGPIGAIVGGLVGLIGGALIGEAVSTRRRSLKQDEVNYAKDVFKDSIDYSKIEVTRDAMYTVGAPLTIGNTIHLKSSWDHFVGDTLDLTQEGLETLIHEMGHVWQYQNGGLAYIPRSLWSQFRAWVTGGERGGAYDWRPAHQAGTPWEEWNPEQQAQAIEDYNLLLRKSKDGTASVAELAELSTLLPYMQKVWRGEGAPTFEPVEVGEIPI